MKQGKQNDKKLTEDTLSSSPSPIHALIGGGLPTGQIITLAAKAGEGESKIFPDKNKYSIDFKHHREYTIEDIEKSINQNTDTLQERLNKSLEEFPILITASQGMSAQDLLKDLERTGLLKEFKRLAERGKKGQ